MEDIREAKPDVPVKKLTKRQKMLQRKRAMGM